MEVVYRNDGQGVLYEDVTLFRREMLLEGAAWETVTHDCNPFWDMRFSQFYSDGIHMGYCNGHVHEALHITTTEQSPMPGIAFMQQGSVLTTAHGEKEPQQFFSGEHNFFLNPYTAKTSFYKQQQDLKIFVLSFLPERFLALAENTGPVMEGLAESIAGKGASSYKKRQNLPLTPQMYALIESINHSPYQGGLRKLFLQSKALELLALQCAQLGEVETRSNPAIKLFPADIRKVHTAREILLHDLQHPPSMTLLARQTGLNTFKLKAGFKQVFGNSVFGYLKNYRLEQARDMIREGGKTITAVAYETGYSTLQHFSNEFRKKFGISPKGMRD